MNPVNFCPSCGKSLLMDRSLLNGFSDGDHDAYFCWCSRCHFRCEIMEVVKVTAPDQDPRRASRPN